MSGAGIVEVVLGIPGLGELLWEGTLLQDFGVVLAAAWAFALLSGALLSATNDEVLFNETDMFVACNYSGVETAQIIGVVYCEGAGGGNVSSAMMNASQRALLSSASRLSQHYTSSNVSDVVLLTVISDAPASRQRKYAAVHSITDR